MTRIPLSDTEKAYFPDEADLWAAYLQHLQVAEFLSSNFPLEAYRNLVLAVECYLKDIFCCLRYQRFGPTSSFGSSVSIPGPLSDRFKNFLSCKKAFGHDVRMSANTLKAMCNIIDSGNFFKLFVMNLPQGTAWIEERYSPPPQQIQNHSLQKYSSLVSTFQDLRTNIFPRYL